MKEFRLALRQLIRSPGFTLLAIITLGLGIGANTAMFSVINSILLKPLPYPDSAQLDRIDRATAQNPQGRVSPADFLDLQRQMQAYGEIGAYALGDTSLSEPGQPAEMVQALRTTANFFSVLRVQPQLGRDFLPREDLPGTIASLSSVNVAGSNASAAEPTSSAAPSASMANLTRSWACCPRGSTTGVTSARSISSARLLSTNRNPFFKKKNYEEGREMIVLTESEESQNGLPLFPRAMEIRQGQARFPFPPLRRRGRWKSENQKQDQLSHSRKYSLTLRENKKRRRRASAPKGNH